MHPILKSLIEGIKFILKEEQKMIKALTNRQFFVFVVNITIAFALGYFLGLGCGFK